MAGRAGAEDAAGGRTDGWTRPLAGTGRAMRGLLPAPELPPGCAPTPPGTALPPTALAGAAGRANSGCADMGDPAMMMASAWAACCALASGFAGSACARDTLAAAAPGPAGLTDGRGSAAVVLKGAAGTAGVLDEARSGAGADEVATRGAAAGMDAAEGAIAVPAGPTDAVRAAGAAACWSHWPALPVGPLERSAVCCGAALMSVRASATPCTRPAASSSLSQLGAKLRSAAEGDPG